MSGVERASAFVVNQLAWCKSSPDDLCLCPFTGGVNAEYELTSDEVSLKKLNDETVRAQPLPGLGEHNHGDGAELEQVRVYEESRVLREADSLTLITQANGEARVAVTLASDPTIRSIYKQSENGGLSLSVDELTNKTACILPDSFKPRAYCVRVNDGSADPLVVYVQPRMQPEVTIASKQYRSSISPANTLARVIFLSDEQATYVSVTYTAANAPGTRDEWLRVTPNSRSAFSFLAEQAIGSTIFDVFTALQGFGTGQRVVEHATLPSAVRPFAPNEELVHVYEVPVRTQAGERAKITLYDEHLNPVGTLDVDVALTAEQSGITFPTDALNALNPLGTLGGVLGAVSGSS
jgi:ribosomal protein L25 (general stress protein Ctc)